MRGLIFLIACLFGCTCLAGQDLKSKRPSPPAIAQGTIDGVAIRVDYSTPSAKGRKMIGGKDPYGKVWRTGANETTVIEFGANVLVEGKEVPRGRYALFTIPGVDEWTIIINRKIEWGAFTYKETDDVVRVKVIPSQLADFAEQFMISIEGSEVELRWENFQVGFRVAAAK